MNKSPEGDDYWSRLLLEGKLKGPVIHDARIAAICAEAGVTVLSTAVGEFVVPLPTPLGKT